MNRSRLRRLRDMISQVREAEESVEGFLGYMQESGALAERTLHLAQYQNREDGDEDEEVAIQNLERIIEVLCTATKFLDWVHANEGIRL